MTAVLVKENEPRYVVVVGDEAPTTTHEAATELNTWIEKITGVSLAIVRESAWDGVSPYISVGKTKLAEKNGWNKGAFQQEEARVFVENDRIGLVGNDESPYPNVVWRGTYYAVLEFARKRLGVYWIWPGELGEVYEKRDLLEVELGHWTWVPKLPLMRELAYYNSRRPFNLVRDYFSYSSVHPEAFSTRESSVEKTEAWLRRQRLGPVSNLRFSHSFRDWWAKYGADHPDWFARPPEGVTQMGGEGVKLNLSNSAVQNEVFEQWKKGWAENPEAYKIFPVGPNDSRGFDTRPETRAWDHPSLRRYSDKQIYNSVEPNLSDRYVKFWNVIARRIKDVGPDVKLTTFAYRNYRQPPLGDEQIEDNIVIGYVGGEGYYPDEPHIRQEWVGWAKKGARMVWRPNLLHTGHGVPYLVSRALYEDFQFLLRHGMLGAHFDSLTGHWGVQGLTYYVLSELFTRPEATYEELADEYFKAFGPAAEAMRRFHTMFEQKTAEMPELMRRRRLVPRETWGSWWAAHIRIIPLFLSPDVVERADALLDEAERSVADEAATAYAGRVTVVKRAFEHAKLMADVFRKLHVCDPQVKPEYENARDILQSLWDMRLSMVTDPYLVMTVFRTLASEERHLGIWKAFRQTDPEGIKRIARKISVPALERAWLFRADPMRRGMDERWYEKPEGDGWVSVRIGKPWRDALPEEGETPVGWYSVRFDAPDEPDTGGRVTVYFESVDAEMHLWLNGQLVYERTYPHDGNYDSWAEEFWVDVTDAIRYGGSNRLVARIESESFNAGMTGSISLMLER